MSSTIDALTLNDVRKTYGDPQNGVHALKGATLHIADNEFFTLLGPSGCGKTTLLRLLAGFEDATSGEIQLYGNPIEHLAPQHRPINTVFQHYSLFPHKTVRDNVYFGLKMLKLPKAEAMKRVDEMLELVQMTQLADRLPTQLSGGQQQRVALARALAPKPKVLLLDEPLSALDLKLRQAMRLELKQLQEDTGITFVFVTHDQEEALAMSDRIAVLAHGVIQQIGTPTEIYRHPRNMFVADFIGENNFLEVTVESADASGAKVHGAGIEQVVLSQSNGAARGEQTHLAIRPEGMSFTSSGRNTVLTKSAMIKAEIYLGNALCHIVALPDGQTLTIRDNDVLSGVEKLPLGQAVTVYVDRDAPQIIREQEA